MVPQKRDEYNQNNYSNKNYPFNSQIPLNNQTRKNKNEIPLNELGFTKQNCKKSIINNQYIQNNMSTKSQYLPPININQRNNEPQKQIKLETKSNNMSTETKKVHNNSANSKIFTYEKGQEMFQKTDEEISKEANIDSDRFSKNQKQVILFKGNFILKSSPSICPLKNSQEFKCISKNAKDLIESNNLLNEEIPNELAKNDPYKTKPFNRKSQFQGKQQSLKNQQNNIEFKGIQNYGNTCYLNSILQLLKIIYRGNTQFKEIMTSIQDKDKLFQIILNIINDEESHVSQQNIKDLLFYLRDPIYQFDQKPKDCRHLFSILIQKIRKQEVQDPNCSHQFYKHLKIKIQPSILVISVEQIEKRYLVINQMLKFQNQEDRVVQYKLLAVIFGPGHNYIQVNFNGKQYELNDSHAQQIDQVSSKGFVQLLCYQLVQ
ncbi:ubiquitin carboxyl-terminal hydrolase [Tetrahymena thermophila SB210]|uniref:Ubiquitin carboxyl-terminal hydrolase n=1 Tax=Tetrahymena thermophila (strain SB210) TaxID=312017 RepID=A0A1B9C271_TETTS|nr:ubiquitin carboxyl-terminal hydrolase [Tetrahymena thermophila SB210]